MSPCFFLINFGSPELLLILCLLGFIRNLLRKRKFAFESSEGLHRVLAVEPGAESLTVRAELRTEAWLLCGANVALVWL